MFDLDFIGKDINAYLDENGIDQRIWKDENLAEFTNRGSYAVSLIFQEKEILLFSIVIARRVAPWQSRPIDSVLRDCRALLAMTGKNIAALHP